MVPSFLASHTLRLAKQTAMYFRHLRALLRPLEGGPWRMLDGAHNWNLKVVSMNLDGGSAFHRSRLRRCQSTAPFSTTRTSCSTPIFLLTFQPLALPPHSSSRNHLAILFSFHVIPSWLLTDSHPPLCCSFPPAGWSRAMLRTQPKTSA